MRKPRDKSTLTKFEYIFDHLLVGGIIAYDLVYVVLPWLTPTAYVNRSLTKIIICLLVSSVIGFIISYKNKRTTRNVLADFILGAGIYLIWMFGKYIPNFTRWILSITLIITGISVVLITYSEMKRKQDKKTLRWRYYLKLMKLVRRNAVIACTIIVIIVPSILYFSENQEVTEASNSNILKVQEAYGEKYSLAKNIDQIRLIRNNDTFQDLTYKQKCKVVTAVLHSEANYLGLSKFQIKFKDLKDNILGRFDPNAHCIIINAKQLRNGYMSGGDAKSVLNTCLHECRHYFQYLMMDLYEGSTAEQRNLSVLRNMPIVDWIKNAKNYQKGDGDVHEYNKYADQPMEKDARQYAEKQVVAYHTIIDGFYIYGR